MRERGKVLALLQKLTKNVKSMSQIIVFNL